MTDDPNQNPKRVALVIGSGSVKCAAAIGLQNVLHREGIALDLVVGCSGGSLYAACMALGYDAPTIADMTRRLWTREITRRRSYSAWLRILLPGVFGFDETFGLLDDRLVMERLRAAFGETTFAQAKTPLYVAATDFMTGDQVVLSRGRLVDALRASIAMPYIFKPQRVNGQLLVDGYLSDPLPVGIAIKEGANVIVAMGFESPYQSRITSLPRFSFQISSIMTNNLFKANFAFHTLAHHSEVIPVVPEFHERIRLFDTDKIPYIIEEGERAMEAQLPYLHRLLEATTAR
jgi:NTE family protein